MVPFGGGGGGGGGGGLVISCYARLQMENLPTSCNILPVHFTSTWRSVDYASLFFFFFLPPL
jgi:hypothetical protein